jgi:predicted DNA-binding protein YlxM (UPF0122 family)
MGRPKSIAIDSETLRKLYVDENLSLAEIAAQVGGSAETIRHRLVENGIPAHPAQRRFAVAIPEEELRQLYTVEKLGLKELAKRFGATYNGVRNAILRAGVAPNKRGQQIQGPYQSRKTYPRFTTNHGYLTEYAPGHPRQKKRGNYVATHVLVAEKAIGRYLNDGEVVHHINLQKADNRIENLAILNGSQHGLAHRYMEHIAAYLCGLSDICPEALDFGGPVFWGGKYVDRIDLIKQSGARPLAEPAAITTAGIESLRRLYEIQ